MWALGLAALAELALERDVVEKAVPVRRWCAGRGRPPPPPVDSSSEVTDDEDCDVGGDAPVSRPVKTRAQGARVRSVGARSGRAPTAAASRLDSWRFGRVNAQFSQGPARRVT
jgi:hypothetical protein